MDKTIKGPPLWNLMVAISDAIESKEITREAGNEICQIIADDRKETDRGPSVPVLL